MKFSATIKNEYNSHEVIVETNGNSRSVTIPSKESGWGSSVNGGEMLLLALATCFCNDLYREAKKHNIKIKSLQVHCTGEFGAEGEPGKNFEYSAMVDSDEPIEKINELIQHTDKVAEIHNTLRQGLKVELKDINQ